MSKQTSISDLPALVGFVRALDRVQKAGQPLSSVPIPDFHFSESQKLAADLVYYMEKSLIKTSEVEAIIALALGSDYK